MKCDKCPSTFDVELAANDFATEFAWLCPTCTDAEGKHRAKSYLRSIEGILPVIDRLREAIAVANGEANNE